MSSNSSLLDLATEVKTLTERIVEQLAQAQIAEPTFSAASTEVPQTPQYAALRASLNDAANDLLRLVNGPKVHFRSVTCSHGDLAVLQVAFELGLFKSVPAEGTISLQTLAENVGVDEDRLSRVLRYLISQRTFEEPEPGFFGHNSQSILFQQEAYLAAAAHYQLDEFFKAASETAGCLTRFPHQSDAVHSPFAERFGVPLFKHYQQRPKDAARFAQAMAGIVKLDRQVMSLKEGYPWQNIEGKLVDVGGGSGHVSVFLASHFPKLSIVVEDGSLDMLAQGKSLDLNGLNGRIQFKQHDFFTPQPEADAAAYLIRQVLHNWNDEDCIKILRAMVPAMEKCAPGTPLLINDTILPEPGTLTRFEEHSLRQMDIMMLIALGAKQRTEKEFKDILHRADPRFQVVQVYGDAAMGLLEVHLVR